MSYTPIITVTGKIQDFLGNNAVGATVSVRLTNFGIDNPRVPGSCIISSPKIPVAQDGLGGFSFTPIGNDVITPANTYYEVKFTADTANTAALVIPYQFTGTGSQDLSQIIPFNQGGIGGPQISNIVVKNPTALQTIASFGLSVPQIQDLTAPLLPYTAGGTDIGSASLPFANVYVGAAATNNIKVTGTASAARTFTLPDANSNSVQPVSGVTAHQWLTFIDSSGVQHTAQPDYSDLTGKPQLANTFGAVSHQFLTAYDATTGNLAAAQPSFSDISGVAVSGQIPNLDASKITTGTFTSAQIPNLDASKTTTGTFSTAQIPNLDASKITTGQVSTSRGGTGADLSATGGASQVLKQVSSGAAVTVGQLAFSDISGNVAAAQLPNPSASTLGGVESIAAQSHKWINSISTSGVPSLTQPSVSDLSDGTIGSGSVVLATSPTLVTPNIGAATATSVTGLTGAVTPNAAGGTDIGSAAKPFANVYVGGSGTNNIKVTGTATAARTLTLPDADSVTVKPFNGVSHRFVTSIISTGDVIAGQPSVADLTDGSTGSGSVVLSTSPTLVTPTLGVASATTVNKVAITAPATGSTLAIADGKTLTASNTLTFAGTDATTLTFQGTGTVVNRDSTDTLTHKTIDTAGTGNHIQIGGVDLPGSIGTNGQVLTNSSGTLAFTTVSGGGGGTPGGATNSIQYNNGSSFSGSMCLTPAGTIAPNAAFKSSIKTFSATGNSDLYTCPSNKRAIITEMTVFNGHATASSTLVAMLKIGGIYYPASASATVNAQTTGSRSVTYVLEAGEILAVNMTQQPFNVVVSIMEFDNTSNIKSAKLTTSTLTSGDNTVYTVPNGKSALVLNNTLTMCSGTQGTFTAGNNSGGNITYKWNVVPSGGSVGTTNQMSASTTVSTGTGSSQTLTGFTMGAGDFISVNLSAGTSDQIAFVTVVEI